MKVISRRAFIGTRAEWNKYVTDTYAGIDLPLPPTTTGSLQIGAVESLLHVSSEVQANMSLGQILSSKFN